MIHKWSIFNSYATLPEAKSSLCGFIHVLFRNAWANYHVLCTHSVGLLGGSNVRLRTQLNQQSAAKRIFPLFPQARWKWKVALKMAQRCFPFLYYTMVYRRCLMWTGEGMKKNRWFMAPRNLDARGTRPAAWNAWSLTRGCLSQHPTFLGRTSSCNKWWKNQKMGLKLSCVVIKTLLGWCGCCMLLPASKTDYYMFAGCGCSPFPFCVHVFCTILNLAWSVAWKWVCQACIYKQKWCQPGKSTWIVHSNLII